MRKKIEEMTNQELEQKKWGLIKTNKVLSWSARACASLCCLGLVFGLALTLNSASKNEDLIRELGISYDEYKSQVVEAQIIDLQSQVEQGKLSFKDYEIKVEEIKEPTFEEFQTTWTEEQRAKHEENMGNASNAVAITTGSGILGISSLMGIAIGGLVTTKKIGDIECEVSHRKDVEKEMARQEHFAKTCETLAKLDEHFDNVNYARGLSTSNTQTCEKNTQEKVEDFGKTCKTLDSLDK